MVARLPAAQRRRQLLDVALQAFARHGYRGTSVLEVARAAGVTKPVLYQHFSSKRALYLELIDDVAGRLEEAVAKAAGDAEGPRQQVEAGFAAYFRFVTDQADAFRVLFTVDGRDGADDELVGAIDRVESTMARTIAALIDVEGLDDSDRLLLAHGIVGIGEATSRYWLANGHDPDPEALAHRVAELAWAGLRGIRRP